MEQDWNPDLSDSGLGRKYTRNLVAAGSGAGGAGDSLGAWHVVVPPFRDPAGVGLWPGQQDGSRSAREA